MKENTTLKDKKSTEYVTQQAALIKMEVKKMNQNIQSKMNDLKSSPLEDPKTFEIIANMNKIARNGILLDNRLYYLL